MTMPGRCWRTGWHSHGELATAVLLWIGLAPALARGFDCTNATLAERENAIMEVGKDDATWVLTSAFVILTMQSGFGSLESGSVDPRFVVNVMMKNVIDVALGGFSYWMVGYGISFGHSWRGFMGTEHFFVNMAAPLSEMAERGCDAVDRFSHYIFHFTFASTATTIVSGAVAGRMKFSTYMLFSVLNTLLYAFPCHWVWHEQGLLSQMGFVDFAGDGPVHLMGGINGLVGAWMVGTRPGRFDHRKKSEFGLQNPMSCIFGLFMLWWGWLGFNCGSTYGVSGNKWLVAARVAVTTINASIGGGVFGVAYSFFWKKKGLVDTECVINGILSGLVAITGGCSSVMPVMALFIGTIGAALCLTTNDFLIHKELVDDPVGAVGVHGTAALWGLLAIGVFADNELVDGPELPGLIHFNRAASVQLEDGSVGVNAGRLLWVQSVGGFVIIVWTAILSWFAFKLLDLTVGLRATYEDMETGFDLAEHGIDISGVKADAEQEDEEDPLSAMAKTLDSLRIELYEARANFEASRWEMESLRHRQDRMKEESSNHLGREEKVIAPASTLLKRAFPATDAYTPRL